MASVAYLRVADPRKEIFDFSVSNTWNFTDRTTYETQKGTYASSNGLGYEYTNHSDFKDVDDTVVHQEGYSITDSPAGVSWTSSWSNNGTGTGAHAGGASFGTTYDTSDYTATYVSAYEQTSTSSAWRTTTSGAYSYTTPSVYTTSSSTNNPTTTGTTVTSVYSSQVTTTTYSNVSTRTTSSSVEGWRALTADCLLFDLLVANVAYGSRGEIFWANTVETTARDRITDVGGSTTGSTNLNYPFGTLAVPVGTVAAYSLDQTYYDIVVNTTSTVVEVPTTIATTANTTLVQYTTTSRTLVSQDTAFVTYTTTGSTLTRYTLDHLPNDTFSTTTNITKGTVTDVTLEYGEPAVGTDSYVDYSTTTEVYIGFFSQLTTKYVPYYSDNGATGITTVSTVTAVGFTTASTISAKVVNSDYNQSDVTTTGLTASIFGFSGNPTNSLTFGGDATTNVPLNWLTPILPEGVRIHKSTNTKIYQRLSAAQTFGVSWGLGAQSNVFVPIPYEGTTTFIYPHTSITSSTASSFTVSFLSQSSVYITKAWTIPSGTTTGVTQTTGSVVLNEQEEKTERTYAINSPLQAYRWLVSSSGTNSLFMRSQQLEGASFTKKTVLGGQMVDTRAQVLIFNDGVYSYRACELTTETKTSSEFTTVGSTSFASDSAATIISQIPLFDVSYSGSRVFGIQPGVYFPSDAP